MLGIVLGLLQFTICYLLFATCYLLLAGNRKSVEMGDWGGVRGLIEKRRGEEGRRRGKEKGKVEKREVERRKMERRGKERKGKERESAYSSL